MRQAIARVAMPSQTCRVARMSVRWVSLAFRQFMPSTRWMLDNTYMWTPVYQGWAPGLCSGHSVIHSFEQRHHSVLVQLSNEVQHLQGIIMGILRGADTEDS